MAYIKYKELTKYFDFSKHIKTGDLPWYIYDYVYDDEEILVNYKTFRDHGVFTTDKIVLFDNRLSVRPFKKIYTIPYKSISSILYRPGEVELQFDLESGYQLRLKFVGMNKVHKARLRTLYSYICQYNLGKKIPRTLIDSLVDDKIEVKEGK